MTGFICSLQIGPEGVSFHFFAQKESVMTVVLEVSRKVNLSQKDAHSILTRALKMGFTVRVCSGAARGAEGGAGFVALAARERHVLPTAGRGRKKKTRGIYKIDSTMGEKMADMRRDGLTIRAIARAFRLSTSGVGNYLKRREREALAS